MYKSVAEKKTRITDAIQAIIGEGICDYLGMAVELNRRRVAMVKGGKWSADTARNYCIQAGLNYERDRVVNARRKVIDDAIEYEINRLGTQSIESMAQNLNARKIKTMKGEQWKEKNLQSWINSSKRSRKAFDDNTLAVNLKRTIGKLSMMVKNKELPRSGSWGDCLERAKCTIDHLRGLGV